MEFRAETPENYQQKCCCVLVLDVSGSMNGQPILELNHGLINLQNDISSDPTSADRLEVAIVEFCDRVTVVQQPCLVSGFNMPNLSARGTTKLVDGVNKGIEVLRDRKQWYKNTGQPYYRPWIILITDGEPDSGQDTAALARTVHDSVEKREFVFFAIGVQGANMDLLKSISHKDFQPKHLQGLQFSEFFKWLSATMSVITSSTIGDKVNLPDTSDWTQGFTI